MEDAAVPADSWDAAADGGRGAHTAVGAYKAAAAHIEAKLVAEEASARENGARAQAEEEASPHKKKPKKRGATPHPPAAAAAAAAAATTTTTTVPSTGLNATGHVEARHGGTGRASSHNASAVAHIKQKPKARVAEINRRDHRRD